MLLLLLLLFSQKDGINSNLFQIASSSFFFLTYEGISNNRYGGIEPKTKLNWAYRLIIKLGWAFILIASECAAWLRIRILGTWLKDTLKRLFFKRTMSLTVLEIAGGGILELIAWQSWKDSLAKRQWHFLFEFPHSNQTLGGKETILWNKSKMT